MHVPSEVRFVEFDQPATSGAAWSGNTPLLQGYLVAIRIRPATATTRYDFTLTNRDNYTIFKRVGLTGAFQLNLANGPLPVRSVLTATLSNASADEAFDLTLVVDP